MTHPPTESARFQRAADALAGVAIAGAVSLAALLLWQTTPYLGVTAAEAQALESISTLPASTRAYFRRLFVTAPLTELVLRLAREQLPTLWRARALFLCVNACALILMALVARQGSAGRLTMWWTLALAGVNAQWWLRALQIGPVVATTCAALLVQWAWQRAYAHPDWRRVVGYFAASLVAVNLSPYVGCVLLLYALIWARLLISRRSALSVYSLAPARAVAFVLLEITLLLLALLVALSKTIRPSLPTYITDLAWWRDALQSLWMLVNAASGGSYLGVRVLPSSGSWSELRTAHFVTWILGLLALLGYARSFIGGLNCARTWGLTLLALPLLWSVWTGRSARADASLFVALGWPYVILLSAESSGWLTAQLFAVAERCSRRLARIVLLAVLIGLSASAVLLWFRVQRAAFDVARYDLGDHDLTAPARFLAHVYQPIDTVVYVTDTEHDHDVRLRWSYACLRDTLTTPAALTAHSSQVTSLLLRKLSQKSTGVVWVANYACDSRSLVAMGFTNASFFFAVRVEHLSATSHVTCAALGEFYRRAATLAPYAGQIQRQLCEWYKTADPTLLQQLVMTGQAQRDLAGCKPVRWRPYQRAAANAVLYAWSHQYPKALSTALYPPFHEYVSAVGPRLLDQERVLFIYRHHIEDALRSTNLVLANAALTAARSWDRSNPYLQRLAAQICLLEDPTQKARARRLNARAARTYERRYGRPFIEALFANMLLDKEEGRIARAIASCSRILKLVQQEKFIPATVQTNTTPEGERQRAEWLRQRLFWEAQCHSYLAWLLLSTGDYNNAVAWLSRNLAPRFDEVRRMAAYEQLARLYAESGDLPRAVRHFQTLAALATTSAQRIHWLVQAAQLHVSAGDTVAAHDTWQQILELADTLDNAGRRALVRNKQYQRLAQYLARRMNVDGRDAVILALQARAQDHPDRAAWCYRQIAHIERSRLRYDAADTFFERAMQLSPPDPDAYLDAAIYYYRRLHYHRAAAIFSNLLMRLSVPTQEEFLRTDWRFALLHIFSTQGRPTPEAAALAWLAAAATNFSEPAAYANARGNILAFYDHFDEATNAFTQGITTNITWFANYLDLGYLLASRGDTEATTSILDQLDTLPGASRLLRGDWRHVVLHHVAVRPYLPDKEADED